MTPVRRLAHYAMSLGVAAAGMLVVTTLAADAAAGPPTVNVYVAKNHAIAMTQRIRPGIHKYVINSGAEAGFQLLQAVPGYTKTEASDDVFLAFSRGRLAAQKRFEANVTLLGGASSEPGHPTVMWLKLPAGDYWAVDTNDDRTRPGKILTVHVSGKRVEGGQAGTDVIRAIHHTDWARSPGSISHKGRLKFRNDSRDNHFVILAKLADGKTMEDWNRWIRKAKRGVNAPPPIDNVNELDTGVVSPGHEMTVKYNLPPGRYVLTCFWSDAENDGMPHAFMGMNRGIRLT